MKLVIQIPSYNEEESIGEVLRAIPQKIKGIDEIQTILIDDFSQDKTIETAQKFNIKIIKLKQKSGLVGVFKKGIQEALKNRADVLVNLDGDNQYQAKDIERLIQPIIKNEADIVIGTRPIDKIKTFSPFKKLMQKFGSLMVKSITKIDVKDASSGFRAFSRKALLKLNIFNNFTYTIESIIQAANKGLIIKNIDININEQKNRKSRLFKNDFDYIFKQAKNLIRFFIIYRPAKFFFLLASMLFIFGFGIGARFLYFYLNHDGSGHIQSLILCAIILILSFICFMLAIVGDLFSINRKILEEIQFILRENKYKQ